MNKRTKIIAIAILSVLIALFFALTALGIVFIITGFFSGESTTYIQGFVYVPLGIIFASFTIVILVMICKRQKKYWKN